MKNITLTLLLLLGSAGFTRADDEAIRRILEQLVEVTADSSDSGADRTGVVDEKDREAAVVIRRILKTRKVTVNFDSVPFDDTISFLRDVTGLNIVTTKAAKDLITDSGKPVQLKLRDVKLLNCLTLLLESVSKDLVFGVKFGVLQIATRDEFKARTMALEFYDVSDILNQPPDFPAPELGLGTLNPKKP